MDLSDGVIVKSSRLKSVVWNDFDRFKKGDTCVAVCKHCKKKLSGSSTSGTSHLRNHLIRCQRRSNPTIPQALTSPIIPQLLSTREKKKEGVQTLSTYNFDQDSKRDESLSLVNIKFEHDQMKEDVLNSGSNTFDQRRSRFDLARMIILHGYPLSMVDHVRFKIFVKDLQPLFDLVTFDNVEADCMKIYEDEKQKVNEVLDKLPGKISVSVDTWLSMGDAAEYLSLTAHYIDEDWQLKKKILNFSLVDSSHTEDTHSDIIMTSLMKWDIDRKLFSMTFDSSLTSDNIALRIKDRLSQNRFLFSNGKLFDVRCAANLLKLMVEDAMEALYEETHKIRECVRYVKSSLSIQEKFYEIAQQVGVNCEKYYLSVDNELQWNSTYDMLQAALEYKSAFCLLHEHDPAYTWCPSETEWERARVVTSYLKFFIEFTNLFTTTKYPTANTYFPEICAVHLQLIDWCNKTSDEYLSSLAMKMKAKFEEYWEKCSLGLAVAAILDPRFKMKLVEYYFPQIYGNNSRERINEVSNCVKTLYNEHSLGSPLACIDQGLDWQVSSNGGEARDRLMGFDKYLHETSQGQGTNSDFDKYLEEPLFPRNVDFSILNWWKVHSPRYPVLSMMARNVLAVPMSKVGSESAFNPRHRALDHNRSSLAPNTVQALICSQDWIQSELES